MRWIFIVAVLALAPQAWADPCAVLAQAQLRDAKTNLRMENCRALVRSRRIPNERALSYTLNYLADNFGALKDPSCSTKTLTGDPFCRVCKNPQQVQSGIRNSCRFLINDLKKPWGDGSTRTTGYFVDLCQPNGPVVKTLFMNVGTGTAAHGNIDRDNAHSTLAGAFLTDDQVSDFFPYNPAKYQDLKRHLGGRLPAVRLIGLNSSNNETDQSKPMHVSPFKTSWGCPSVGPEGAPIMKLLTENGSTLFMNYHSAAFEQTGASCENGGDASQPRSSSGASSRARPRLRARGSR